MLGFQPIQTQPNADYYAPEEHSVPEEEVDISFRPTDSLLTKIEKIPLKQIIDKATVSSDIDSIIISSSHLYELNRIVNRDAVSEFHTSVAGIKASHSSRLSVNIMEIFPINSYSRKVRNLPLFSFPNICLGHIVVGNIKLHLHIPQP